MSPALENGEYRFNSVSPSGSNNYLGVRSGGQVFGLALDAFSEGQKWRVTLRSDGYYDITNLGTNSLLRVDPPSKGEIAYTLNVRGAKEVPWDLEDYNGYIIFKCSGKYAPNVINLDTWGRLVLWGPTKQPNQLWIAENLAGGPAPTPRPLPTHGPRSTSAVADGAYRFQSLADNDGDDYLTLTAGEVRSGPPEGDSEKQKWKVTNRDDGHYDIANVGTGDRLTVSASRASEMAYTLSVNGNEPTSWDFERYGNKVLIQAGGEFLGKVVSLSERNRVTLLSRNGLINQRWFIEPVVDLPPPPEPPKPSKIQPTWVAVQGNNIPEDAIVGGYQPGEPTLYVARAHIEDRTHPGKAGKQLPGNCLVPWASGEKSSSNYEVLIASPGTYRWVPVPDGGTTIDLSRLPRLIVGGNSPSTGDLHVIRGPVGNNARVPGYLYQNGFSIALNGNVVRPTTGREVLCYAD